MSKHTTNPQVPWNRRPQSVNQSSQPLSLQPPWNGTRKRSRFPSNALEELMESGRNAGSPARQADLEKRSKVMEAWGEFPFGNRYLACADERQRQLMEAFLRRGFLMQPVGRAIWFDQKPILADKLYLRSILGPLALKEPLSDDDIPIFSEKGELLFAVPAEASLFDEALARLKNSKALYHVNGAKYLLYCTYYDFYQSWEHFKALRYGLKVPVKVLDPGVALMVKVLPWYGVATNLCCEGHPKGNDPDTWNSPHVALVGEHHARWARMLVARQVADLGPRVPSGFVATVFRPAITTERRYGWGGGVVGEDLELPAVEHSLWLDVLFRIAVRMVDPDLAAEARMEKAKLMKTC